MNKSVNKKAVYLRERYHSDPAFKKKHQERSRAYYHRPECQPKRKAYQIEYNNRPEVKARVAKYLPDYLKKYHENRCLKDPAFKERKRKTALDYYHNGGGKEIRILLKELKRIA